VKRDEWGKATGKTGMCTERTLQSGVNERAPKLPLTLLKVHTAKLHRAASNQLNKRFLAVLFVTYLHGVHKMNAYKICICNKRIWRPIRCEKLKRTHLVGNGVHITNVIAYLTTLPSPHST
jgi:hypothetical protein